MHAHNSSNIEKYNPRKLFPLVDNKVKTKEHAIKTNVSIPVLYYVVEIEHQLKNIYLNKLHHYQVLLKF